METDAFRHCHIFDLDTSERSLFNFPWAPEYDFSIVGHKVGIYMMEPHLEYLIWNNVSKTLKHVQLNHFYQHAIPHPTQDLLITVEKDNDSLFIVKNQYDGVVVSDDMFDLPLLECPISELFNDFDFSTSSSRSRLYLPVLYTYDCEYHDEEMSACQYTLIFFNFQNGDICLKSCQRRDEDLFFHRHTFTAQADGLIYACPFKFQYRFPAIRLLNMTGNLPWNRISEITKVERQFEGTHWDDTENTEPEIADQGGPQDIFAFGDENFYVLAGVRGLEVYAFDKNRPLANEQPAYRRERDRRAAERANTRRIEAEEVTKS